MASGTMRLQSGRLDLETIVRAPLLVIADPVVAASGPAPTLDDLAGAGSVLLERPGGSILVLGNPDPDSGLFVWATATSLAVVADPDTDTVLETAGELTVCSGRLVVGAPDVVAAWGADVDTGDGSAVRCRMHRGRTRLGLIVVAQVTVGRAALTTGPGAVAVTFPAAGLSQRQQLAFYADTLEQPSGRPATRAETPDPKVSMVESLLGYASTAARAR